MTSYIKNPRLPCGKRGFVVKLDSQEELDQEQSGDNLGQNGNVLELAGEDLDQSIGD